MSSVSAPLETSSVNAAATWLPLAVIVAATARAPFENFWALSVDSFCAAFFACLKAVSIWPNASSTPF